MRKQMTMMLLGLASLGLVSCGGGDTPVKTLSNSMIPPPGSRKKNWLRLAYRV